MQNALAKHQWSTSRNAGYAGKTAGIVCAVSAALHSKRNFPRVWKIKTKKSNNENLIQGKMKTTLFTLKCLAVAVAAFSLQLLGTATGSAQDLFPAHVNVVGISTNSGDGNLAYKELDNRDLIQAAASANGLTNLDGLSLVYNVEGSDVEVVSGTNKTVIGTPLTFSGGVSLSNTNDTKAHLLKWVYWGTNSVASGTMAAGERIQYGSSNQITGFTLEGQLQFALPDNGTNGPTIYLGHLNVEHRTFNPIPGESDGSSRE